MTTTFEQRLGENYEELSAKLKLAGDYIAENPVDTATRSLRAVAQESGLAPATFSRLARALDYDDFEQLRDELRDKIGRRVHSFADRAGRLQQDHGKGPRGFFDAHAAACMTNLQRLHDDMDTTLLEQAVDRLHDARTVMLVGALGSTGVVEYLAYMANFCSGNWRVAGHMGASLGSALVELDSRDVLLIVTKPPFSTSAIRAAELARAQGVYVVVITDTHTCPALRHASAGFIVPTDSPHFYSSYVATLFLAETMIGMLVSRAGPAVRQRIAQIEKRNRRLEEVWDG